MDFEQLKKLELDGEANKIKPRIHALLLKHPAARESTTLAML